MTNLRSVLLLAFLLLCFPSHKAKAATGDNSRPQSFLALTRANNGQLVTAIVGQIIQIDLETLQGAGYGTPEVSSGNVVYRNSVLAMPPNPGGPLPIFIFEAESEGQAEIRIPRRDAPGFSVTIEVHAASAKDEFGDYLDQSNTNESGAGWTNLVNHAVQTFTPSLPRLIRVQVRLVDANPGSDPDDVTLTLLNSHGEPMAALQKSVAGAGWIMFVFANGGVDVTPGDVYAIEVNGSTRFAWKYIENGYNKGEALFNGKPILKGAHASFLFKAFSPG